MVSTRPVRPLVRPDLKVNHLALDESSGRLAWVEGATKVCMGQLDSGGEFETLRFWMAPHQVSYLGFHRDGLVVGDDLGSLAFHDLDGSPIETQDIDGGVQTCRPMGLKLAVLTGMGEVVLVQRGRPSVSLSQLHGLDDVVHVEVHDQRVFIAEQNGTVLACEGQSVVWRRPARGVHGERITAMGLTTSGRLFLTREGHALVAGEEEAIEFEFWENDRLIVREDLRRRLLTSSPSSSGAILGFDDGSVHRLHEDGRMEPVLETGYAVFACLEQRFEVIASSWFYVHGLHDEQPWKIEHQGMPRLMCTSERLGGLVFAGDDQNDYTAAEPIGWVDLSLPVEDLDAAELTLWFQEEAVASPLSAEELYGDDDDVLTFLTDEEQEHMRTGQPEVAHASLLEAMDAEVAASEPSSEGPTEDELMEALQSGETLTLEETGSLLDALSASVEEFIAPRAVAGDDQRHVADDDGTCIVLLDGRGSFDPQDQIATWSWCDERGQELADVAQVKLKLPLGRHRFELRVVDRQGSWTTDALVVSIVDGSTS